MLVPNGVRYRGVPLYLHDDNYSHSHELNPYDTLLLHCSYHNFRESESFGQYQYLHTLAQLITAV